MLVSDMGQGGRDRAHVEARQSREGMGQGVGPGRIDGHQQSLARCTAQAPVALALQAQQPDLDQVAQCDLSAQDGGAVIADGALIDLDHAGGGDAAAEGQPADRADQQRQADQKHKRPDCGEEPAAAQGQPQAGQQVPQQLAQAVADFTNNKYVVLALLNVIFLLAGLFLHSAAAIILIVPIVMPLVNLVGIDPVHFGIIVTLNLGIGQQTPPVASVLVTACSIAKADIWAVSKVNVYFIGVLMAVLLLSTYVPIVPMGLVELFYR